MVRKSNAARRSTKHCSQISALKNLSLLDRSSPELPQIQIDPDESLACPDWVYLQAAAIFQSSHLEKPAAHRLISYGKRAEVSVPDAWDEASQRAAYQLAFNTLKYQELLEDVLIDSCFCLAQPMPDRRMSLVVVLLTDLLERKFLPRLQPASQKEDVKAVREVEACLLRFKTKLVASLARCRIKHDLLTLDRILPETIRHRQERATHLLLYAWINTLRCSVEEVSEVLHTSGFVCVKSVGQLEGRTFCKDLQCHDLLVFPNSVKRELSDTRLLSDCRLVIQDKSCCLGPCALRPLLAEGGDVLMAGCFSAQTVAHVSAVAASASAHTLTEGHTTNTHSQTVIVCLGDAPQSHTDKLQTTLFKLGCKNVKLLANSLESLDVSDVRLLKVAVVFLMPACSLSAVSNPVDYIMHENRDSRLMLDLSQGSVSPEKLQTLAGQQKKELQRAVQFPQVRAVLYSTCSVHSEENEEVLRTVLTNTQENQFTEQPYRLSCPALLQDHSSGDEEMKTSFFTLEPSDRNNGCFLALLTRELKPEVTETPQDVLARAAAKGLLDGLHPNPPIKKQRRLKRTRRAPANQKHSVKTRPHATQSNQSLVAEFLNREMKESHSVPTLNLQNSSKARIVSHLDKPASSASPSQSTLSRTDSTAFFSSPRKSLTRLVVANNNDNHSTPPPMIPKGRHEVLRPATVTFPPVLLSNVSQVPPNPAHLFRTPPLSQTQSVFRGRMKLRPWL